MVNACSRFLILFIKRDFPNVLHFQLQILHRRCLCIQTVFILNVYTFVSRCWCHLTVSHWIYVPFFRLKDRLSVFRLYFGISSHQLGSSAINKIESHTSFCMWLAHMAFQWKTDRIKIPTITFIFSIVRLVLSKLIPYLFLPHHLHFHFLQIF